MSRISYTITYDIEVSPDVDEEAVCEGVYKTADALEGNIVRLAKGLHTPDVDICNISIAKGE